MTSTLRTLLDRVEKGEGADREIDALLDAAFDLRPSCYVGDKGKLIAHRDGYVQVGKGGPSWCSPVYTSSVDCALRLFQQALPKWDISFEILGSGKAYADAVGPEFSDSDMSEWARSHLALPARALVSALLRAKIAQEGEEAYWSAPKDEDRCTAMAAAYRAMRAAAKADAPDPHVLQDRLHGMLRMAVASEDSFNRLSPAGRRLIQAAEGFFASSREDRDDLNACWDALQAETKRADAAEARLAALLRAKIAQEEGA